MKKKLVMAIASIMSIGMLVTGCGSAATGSAAAGAAEAGNKDSQVAGAKVDASEVEGADEGSAAAADKIIIFQSKAEIQDQLEDCAESFTKETGIEVEIWGTTGDD